MASISQRWQQASPWSCALIVLCIGGVFGWGFEHWVMTPDVPTHLLLGLPFMPTYGFGTLLIYWMHCIGRQQPRASLFAQVITTTLIVNSLECISGQIQWRIKGTHPWSYSNYELPMCNGFVSARTAAGWLGIIWFLLSSMDLANL